MPVRSTAVPSPAGAPWPAPPASGTPRCHRGGAAAGLAPQGARRQGARAGLGSLGRGLPSECVHRCPNRWPWAGSWKSPFPSWRALHLDFLLYFLDASRRGEGGEWEEGAGGGRTRGPANQRAAAARAAGSAPPLPAPSSSPPLRLPPSFLLPPRFSSLPYLHSLFFPSHIKAHPLILPLSPAALGTGPSSLSPSALWTGAHSQRHPLAAKLVTSPCDQIPIATPSGCRGLVTSPGGPLPVGTPLPQVDTPSPGWHGAVRYLWSRPKPQHHSTLGESPWAPALPAVSAVLISFNRRWEKFLLHVPPSPKFSVHPRE